MSNTSKKYFDEKFEREIWGEFIKKVHQVKSEKEMVTALSRVFTATELNVLEKRLAVLYLLKQKLPYRKISEIADVHYNTISFIKKGLKRPARVKKIYSSFPSKRKRKISKFPTYTGKGRWRFLNSL